MHGLSPATKSNHSPTSDSDSDDDLEEHDSLLDPFELESDDDGSSNDEDLLQNTRGNSGPDRSKALLRTKIPPNPFHSTLASESRKNNITNDEHATETSRPPERHYDVDSFTRLLLTGEGRGLVSKSDGTMEKMRPAAPQHHNEKPMIGTSEETELSQDIPLLPSVSTASPVKPTSWSTPSSPQAPVNLNKPLPPPPVTSESQILPSADTGVPVDISLRDNIFLDQANQSNSKPPLSLSSRYSSQTRLNPLVVTSERSSLGSGNGFEELQASYISPPPSGSKPPPPPPPRRHGRARGVSASSTSSAISGASASLTPSSADEFSARPFKQQPAIPPARTPSNSSMTRPTRRSTHPDSPSKVAPPAPPPRRETSRNSYSRSGQIADHLPLRINRHNSDLWASWASPPAKAVLGEELSDTDVLAGLSELQREVDELREKFRD